MTVSGLDREMVTRDRERRSGEADQTIFSLTVRSENGPAFC